MVSLATRLCLLSAVGLAVAACAGDKKAEEADPNVFPAAYREQILGTLSSTLDDPTNVREAFIGEPVLVQAGRDQRYAVCMRFNARNLVKQYTGSKERIAYFYGGQLNQLVEATKEQCGKAAYKPWPELEKYCLAKSCA
jgi:hypothetical protein